MEFGKCGNWAGLIKFSACDELLVWGTDSWVTFRIGILNLIDILLRVNVY